MRSQGLGVLKAISLDLTHSSSQIEGCQNVSKKRGPVGPRKILYDPGKGAGEFKRTLSVSRRYRRNIKAVI